MAITVNQINAALAADPAAFIQQSDEAYDAQITAVAQDIMRHREQSPIILLSGPSGSGKTTTAKKIEAKLDAWGCETHTLSMDDYFIPLTEKEQRLAAEKKLDLESPGRVDIPFLNEQLESIMAGRPTPLPHFSFVDNSRSHGGKTLTLKHGELVILEGIHALNPDVITIPEDRTARVYVSVRTRIDTGEGLVLHPKRIRLLRRMLRDKLFRNRSVEQTLIMFETVQRGENRYIMPYKPRAAYEIDTFCPYEVSAYRQELLPVLQALPPRVEITELCTVLEKLYTLDPATVPADSLIREFLGPLSLPLDSE